MKVSVVVCRVQQRDATNRRRFAVRSQKVSTAGIYISLKRTKYQKFSFLYSVGRARQRDQECGLAKGWREEGFQGFQLISSGLELNPGRRRHWHWQGAVAKFSPPHATLPATLLLLLLLLLLHNFSHLENPMKANFERQAAKMSFLHLQICQN